MPNFGLEITPRPDLPAIVARWQREITASELQAGYVAILAAADALGCGRWLLDLRRRDEVVSTEINHWVETEFFPLLPGRYPAPVRIAFLISPLRAAQQAASSVAAISAATRPEHGYHTKLFTEEAAAYQWLGS